MATDVPQRQLRNHTADLLRRVEEGERLRITVHGHPVAELVPIEERPKRFVPRERFEELAAAGNPEVAREWVEEIHQIRREMGSIRDPWEKLEEINAERSREASEER